MEDSTDFTFCQVALQADGDHKGWSERIPNIDSVSLEDNVSARVDLSQSNSTPEGQGSGGSPSDETSGIPPADSGGNALLTQRTVGKAGGLKEEKPVIVGKAGGLNEEKPVIKKPIVRAKVPFEKGYSQMDWLKLTRTEPDLAGLNGQPNRRLISIDEVRQHKTDGSIWTVLKGRVYNISPYMKFHPGGVDMLMKAAGKDCTSLFNKYHAWVNAEFLLEKCLVGVLDAS